MKTLEINGKIQVVNETFAESFAVLNDIAEELGLPAFTENFARRDFGIVGGETNAQLDEWVRDYASEMHSERCENKRYASEFQEEQAAYYREIYG